MTFTEQDKRMMLRVISDVPVTFTYTDGTGEGEPILMEDGTPVTSEDGTPVLSEGTGTGLSTFTAAATTGALLTTQPLSEGGYEITPDLTITTTIQKLDTDGVTLVDRFTNVPAATNRVGVGGVNYRIEQTTSDEITSALVLDLVSVDR